MSEQMSLQEVNMVIAEFMDSEYCNCTNTTICPSPSAHHDHCLNEECGKIHSEGCPVFKKDYRELIHYV